MTLRDAWLPPSKPVQSGFTALADRVLPGCMNSRADKYDLQMSIDLLVTAARSRCPLAEANARSIPRQVRGDATARWVPSA
jgi:hypothetical protein